MKSFYLNLRHRWQAWRKHYWLSFAFDVVLVIAVFVGISQWQSRDMLATDGSNLAPQFELQTLDGTSHQLSDALGKTALVYFFAPWCHICARSASNIEALREARDEDELAIYMVALDYESVEAVEEFAFKHQLTVTVLLGGPAEMNDYRVRGFPTYYVIAPDGSVKSRSIGYSTEIGLRWRTI